MVLIETFSSERFVGKLGNLIGKLGHLLKKSLHIHFILWSDRDGSRRSGTHRIVDQVLAKVLRRQTKGLNLSGKLIRDRDRDLHGKSVAGS